MTRAELLQFISGHKWAVQASVAATGAPQAAVIGFAVTDDLAGRGPNEKESVGQSFKKSNRDRTGLRFTEGKRTRRDDAEAAKIGETASDSDGYPRE